MLDLVWDMETQDPDDFLTLLLLLGRAPDYPGAWLWAAALALALAAGGLVCTAFARPATP